VGIKRFSEQLCCPKLFFNSLAESSSEQTTGIATPSANSDKYSVKRGSLFEAIQQHTLVGDAIEGDYVPCTSENFYQRIDNLHEVLDQCQEEESFARLNELFNRMFTTDLFPEINLISKAKTLLLSWKQGIRTTQLLGTGTWAKEVDRNIEFDLTAVDGFPLPESEPFDTPSTARIPLRGRADLIHLDETGHATVFELKAVRKTTDAHDFQALLYSMSFEPNAKTFLVNNGQLDLLAMAGPEKKSLQHIQNVLSDFHANDFAEERREGNPDGGQCYGCVVIECTHRKSK
jgi:hypothetical protein